MELSISDWIAIVLGVPTILGLIYTVLSKWYEVRENLKIKKSFGFINYGHKLSDEYYLFLECINHGQKTVILSSCFLKLPDKKTIPAFYRNHLSYNFPYELRSGNNFQYSFVVDNLEATLQKYGYQKNVKLVPVFTTQSGKKFSGKAFDLVPDA